MSGLLRLCTAGHVDDGKSTLIGRLLHDARGVYEDQVRAVEAASQSRGAGPIDFSLFTDGLRAEREQGITIDVAYRYFATARRTFILADTPGHEQYTRNMATGASRADLAVLLVDARHGLREQTLRHARIARLLGISSFVLAINKMDLVGFEAGVFDRIAEAFRPVVAGAALRAIPVSALHGDNVIARSARTPWYSGPSLLEYLETVDAGIDVNQASFRFPVQLVLRTADFRGYAGQVTAGVVRRGDRITVWPSGRRAHVRRILTWDGDLDVAQAPLSVTLELEEHLDVSRGDLIATGRPDVTQHFTADVVWMDERPLEPERVYLLKHARRTVPVELDRALSLNDIGTLTLTTAAPLALDRYVEHRGTGSFILIDPSTCFTCGAGMIVAPLATRDDRVERLTAAGRLAHAARGASSDSEAVAVVQRALEEMLR